MFTNLKASEKILLVLHQEELNLNHSIEGQMKDANYDQERKAITNQEVFFKPPENSLLIEINISNVSFFEDIFQNQSVLKKVLTPGYSTASPDELSTVFFDFSIKVNEEQIHSTFTERPQPTQDTEMDFFLQHQFFKAVLREYRFSKAFEKTLQLMKKFEESILILNSIESVQRGEDFELLQNYFKGKNYEFTQEFIDQHAIKIQYQIKMWFFNEGHNTFSLGIEERKKFIENKKLIAVHFLDKGDFKKALKLFEKCHQLSTSGLFDEDKKQFQSYCVSSLMNIGLCYWKMKNWHKMNETCQKVMELDQSNVKAVFRGATALFEMEEYERALELLTSAQNFEESAELKDLYHKVRKEYQDYKKREKELYSKLHKITFHDEN